MATSQNGYTANDRSLIASYTVPGTSLRIALRKGDASVVLLEYLRRYHAEIEPLPHNPQDLWGYAERTIRGSSTTLSNHASGTAVDCRATRHPLGAVGTFTAAEAARLDALLAWFEGVIRHGKDYSGRKDPMHAEINAGPAEVARIADKVRNLHGATPTPAPPPLEDLVQCFDWPAGTSHHKLVCPVGKASMLTKRAWLSIACDGEITALDVWIQGDGGGIAEYHERVAKDRRWWRELPDGTTQIVVHCAATGPVGAALELLPK